VSLARKQNTGNAKKQLLNTCEAFLLLVKMSEEEARRRAMNPPPIYNPGGSAGGNQFKPKSEHSNSEAWRKLTILTQAKKKIAKKKATAKPKPIRRRI